MKELTPMLTPMNKGSNTVRDFIKSEKSENRWALQIIQQILSYYFHIPLRLYDLDKGRSLFDRLELFLKERNREYQSFCSFKEKGCSVTPIESIRVIKKCPSIREFFKARQNSPWLTYGSYMNQMISSLRERIPEFKSLEHIFFHLSFKESLNEDIAERREPIIHDYMFGRALFWGYQALNMGDENVLLVAGPVWRQPSQEYIINLEEEIMEPALLEIERLFGKIDKSEMKRLGSRRYPLTDEIFAERVAVIHDCMAMVLNTRIEADLSVSREDVTNLVIASVLFSY